MVTWSNPSQTKEKVLEFRLVGSFIVGLGWAKSCATDGSITSTNSVSRCWPSSKSGLSIALTPRSQTHNLQINIEPTRSFILGWLFPHTVIASSSQANGTSIDLEILGKCLFICFFMNKNFQFPTPVDGADHIDSKSAWLFVVWRFTKHSCNGFLLLLRVWIFIMNCVIISNFIRLHHFNSFFKTIMAWVTVLKDLDS